MEHLFRSFEGIYLLRSFGFEVWGARLCSQGSLLLVGAAAHL